MQMAKDNPHLQFQKWAQKYGPIYSLILGTMTMIVLSSDQAVKDLLDQRSANTSARPDLYTGQTLLSGGKRMVMMVRVPFLTSKKTDNDNLLDIWVTLENGKRATAVNQAGD
jgi:hypothetical protein